MPSEVGSPKEPRHGPPKGLQRPHRIAELLPVLAALASVGVATVMAFLHIAQTTG